MENKEPYRATRLWNEVISAFQSGMPLKKHRRRIQIYNNCFTAAEAVNWLHCYLMNNANFGVDVTRQQTVNLLQKFLTCHVIESIFVRSKKKEFADDSQLYRFTAISSQISKPSALCLIQSPAFGARNKKPEAAAEKKNSVPCTAGRFQKENLPECHFVERKLSADEVKLVWKKVTLSRLEKQLPASFLDILDETNIDGLVIKHNVTRLSKTGVVCLLDKTDDIPHWVISAMKCLANWPNASGSGSCLPNYPGFEKDVFKVVRDYFINPQVPLLPNYLTPLLIKVFCHFTHNEFCDALKVKAAASESNNSSKSSAVPYMPSTVNTSTPVSGNNSFQNSMESRARHTSHGKLLLDDPAVMWEYPSAVYETDFGTTRPVTRMISGECIPRSRSQSHASLVGSIESVSTISVCSRGQRSDFLNNDSMAVRSPLKAWSSNVYLQDEIKEPILWHKSPLYSPPFRGATSAVSLNEKAFPACNSSASLYSDEQDVYVCEINDLDCSNVSSRTVVEVEEESGHEYKRYNRQGLYHSTSAICSKDASNHTNQTSDWSYSNRLETGSIHSDELKLSFQLILLLLPSTNRRQLHLLMRLLSKILKNGKFVLNIKVSMRQYLLETFLPAIVQSDRSPVFLFRLVAFILDNSEFLFQTPTNLHQEVDNFSRSCFGRIKYTVDDTCTLTYCELVSKQQYEEQKVSVSKEGLKSLLNSIICDPKTADREKKKKLKQFKESHPDVYYLQFPEKLEQPLKSKPTFLNKLVNLRM